MGKYVMMLFEQLNKEFTNKNNWFYSKAIKLIESKSFSLIIESKSDKKQYITFLENNKNFQKLHNSQKKIHLKDEYYTINIDGEIIGNVSPMIYAIEYDENHDFLARKVIHLNKQIIIKKHVNAHFLRLAISLSNKGRLV